MSKEIAPLQHLMWTRQRSKAAVLLTDVPQVQQHGHEDVVDEVETDPISKYSVPHSKQVLHGELTAEQQSHPPAERERNTLFNDALNTFYLRLYGVRYMVKDHSESEKGNPLPPHRLLLSINSKGSFICTIPQTG